MLVVVARGSQSAYTCCGLLVCPTTTMSRIVVKNLPKNVKEEDVRRHFEGSFEITDVSLKHNAEGKFRGFAFVGFKEEEAAAAAVDSNHQTFLGRNRITVEVYDTEAVPMKQKLDEKKKNKRPSREDEDPQKKKKKLDNPMEAYADDPSFQEFLSVQRNVEATSDPKYLWKDDGGIAVRENEAAVEETANESNSISTKKEQPKHKPPSAFPFTVKLGKLPYKVKKGDIKTFFHPLALARVKLPPKIKGIAYVSFKTKEDLEAGLKKHKSLLTGKQVDVIRFKGDIGESTSPDPNNNKTEKKPYHEIKESVTDTGRLYVRNLSYTCTPSDLEQLFSPFGPLTEVYLPIESKTKKPKGFAFVAFMFPEHAVKSMEELDKQIFQGRLLHILPGESKPESASNLNHLSSYQQKKEEEKKKEAKKVSSWNTLFLGINATAEVMADRYAVRKADLLADTTTKDSIAVRMALGETQIVNETKKFLLDNGVDLDSFDDQDANSESSKQVKGRSRNVILVKNLPPKTESSVIQNLFAKHGTVTRVILPQHGVTAVVEMQEESEAKRAFERLINYKVQHIPIYLEWAPVNIFKTSDNTKKTTSQHGPKILVRNVPFEATVKEVEEVFASFGQLKCVRLPKKVTGAKTQHRGFAFVEFHTKSDAQRAFDSLRGSTHLYGRRLVLEWAKTDGDGNEQGNQDDDNEEEDNSRRQKTSLGSTASKLKKSELISRLVNESQSVDVA